MLYKGIAAQQQKHVSDRGSAIKSRLEHLEDKERPADLPHVSMTGMHTTRIKAKHAARITNLTIAYGERTVLDQVNLEVEAGKRTFLVGENGAGKSSLLQALVERQPGTFMTEDARPGYFSQKLLELREEKTVLENVLYDAAEPEPVCRAVLANLYVSRGDLGKKVSVLSGGERVKTALAKLLVSGCNFLILDEPTNHMDIQAKETLESAFRAYRGTILFVSHDRYFIKQVSESVLIFENHGAMYYPFGYDHYMEHTSRKAEGEDLSVQMRAEEQALVAGMRAVPKAERHRLREIPTEDAYMDWKYRLAKERMRDAEAEVSQLWNELLIYEPKYQVAWENWQECIMEWYEIADQLNVFDHVSISNPQEI